MTPQAHIPVMPDEVVELLAVRAGACMLDTTLGLGGHASLLIPKLGPGGTYLGLDTDPSNAAASQARLAPLADAAGVTLHIRHGNFAKLKHHLADFGVDRVDAVLADLGFASNQVDDAARGLSFHRPGPLDMRLDPGTLTTAADLVNTLAEDQLADLIFRYGEERLSRRIARRIVEARAEARIETTQALASVVRGAFGGARRGKGGGGGSGGVDPATRTFQALRIAVNAEMGALDQLLRQLPDCMAEDGRAVVITFHSLEDRPVKQAMRRWQDQGLGQITPRKPVVAGEGELAMNSRARSAKLRGFAFKPTQGESR